MEHASVAVGQLKASRTSEEPDMSRQFTLLTADGPTWPWMRSHGTQPSGASTGSRSPCGVRKLLSSPRPGQSKKRTSP